MNATRYKHQTFHMLQSFNNTRHYPKSRLSSNQKQNIKEFDRIIGQNGNTWDAHHLTSFLQKSPFSKPDPALQTSRIIRNRDQSSLHRRAISTHDHFFKTTKDNKNASKIGFTGVNPLVSVSSVQKKRAQPINQFFEQESSNIKENKTRTNSFLLNQDSQNKFRFTANEVKFRKTDPINNQNLSERSPTNFEKERMMRLISKRHPHGITGIDHPEDPETKYYEQKRVSLSMNTKIRQQPNSNRTHIIDPLWKSKGRKFELNCPIYGGTKGKLTQARKFNNDSVHGYDIINNRIYQGNGRLEIM